MMDKTADEVTGDTLPGTTTNFAAYPESLNERKAHKAGNCSLWTPRDALIDMLRRIDSGEVSPKGCIVVIDYDDEDGGHVAFNASAQDYMHVIGLAGRLFHNINESGYRG
jgi:hypothetical protein